MGGGIDLIVTDPPYGVNFENNEWDKKILDIEWLDLARSISKRVFLTPGNGNQGAYPPPDWTLCWARPGSVQRVRKGTGFSHWEPILVYGDNPMPVDYLVFNANTNSQGIDHPCPKPLPVMKWLVESGDLNGLVLDPFLGSGTTLVACKELNRNGIGIEINEKYCAIAKKRLQNTTKSLFTETLVEPKQLELNQNGW